MKKILIFAGLLFFIGGCGSSNNATPPAAPVPQGTTTFTVTSPRAPSSYNINGAENPALTLQRGHTYIFNLSVAGHPFFIMSVQGTTTSNAFSNGVTGNGSQLGNITFVVPLDAPATLFYDCSIHGGMTGTITVTN